MLCLYFQGVVQLTIQIQMQLLTTDLFSRKIAAFYVMLFEIMQLSFFQLVMLSLILCIVHRSQKDEDQIFDFLTDRSPSRVDQLEDQLIPLSLLVHLFKN